MRRITYICDRCGKEIADPVNHDTLYKVSVGTMDYPTTTYFIKMLSYSITGSSAQGPASRTDDERVHFCLQCRSDFREFMEEGLKYDSRRKNSES